MNDKELKSYEGSREYEDLQSIPFTNFPLKYNLDMKNY